MDFTLTTYRNLLDALLKQGFSFKTFTEFIENPEKKMIVLRHDVDRLPENSLEFARKQHEMSIRGTYYFRVIPESWNEKIIKEIYSLGHEVGYHYEDINRYAVRDVRYAEEQLSELAIKGFKENLEKLRRIVPVKTICMHGSPMSRWDSRLLWKYYDYRDFGIIGEPYFDVNFDEVFYLTDTGRRWDGDSVSIRDKATRGRWEVAEDQTKGRGGKGEIWGEEQKTTAPRPLNPTTFPRFHTTFDIINAARGGRLPQKIMITFHPQRWTDKPVPWMKELIWQNVKNMGKYFLVKMRR